MDHALSEEQVRHFYEKGYLHGVPLLNNEQALALGEQLEEMVDPDHEGREFFYEYHSNESENPDNVLFHALGAWRVSPAFHDALWNPAFLMAAYQLLGADCRLFMISSLASQPSMAGWWPGIRIIPTGLGQLLCPI